MLGQDTVDLVDRIDIGHVNATATRNFGDTSNPRSFLVGLGKNSRYDLDFVGWTQTAKGIDGHASSSIQGSLGLIHIDLPVLDHIPIFKHTRTHRRR